MQAQIVYVGCCGFPVARSRYYSNYKLVELQNTFYDLPDTSWFESIRKEAPQDFIFTVKAWQVITHPSTSPTWRRLKRNLWGSKENYGWLKPTKENLKAWEEVVETSKILKAKFIVLQTPPSLPYNSESVKWIKEFFKEATSITPKDIMIGWEPRGEWITDKALNDLTNILIEYNIVHITDLLKRKPVVKMDTLYTRLHGLNGEINYKYKYKDEDLVKLADLIIELSCKENYILFNNVYMFSDGIRFKSIAASKNLKVI